MIGVSKKLMCIVLCAVMMLSVLSVAAFAEADNGDISTYANYTDKLKSILTNVDGTAECRAKLENTDTSITKIKVVMSLQKYSSSTWTSLYTTTTTVKDYKIDLKKYYTVSSGKYRVVSTFTFYVGSAAEPSVTVTSSSVTF